MPRIQTAQPRVQVLSSSRIKSAPRLGATPRTRGGRWMRIRARWLRAHPLCVECQKAGVVSRAEELDHIAPLWRGGRDDETNYQGLCRECHAAKTAREAAERCSPDRWE